MDEAYYYLMIVGIVAFFALLSFFPSYDLDDSLSGQATYDSYKVLECRCGDQICAVADDGKSCASDQIACCKPSKIVVDGEVVEVN